MTVVSARMKSSAVSVSSFPALSLLASAPSKPSGFPVVKKKGADRADVASPMPAAVIIADNKFTRNFMFVLHVQWVVLDHQPENGLYALFCNARSAGPHLAVLMHLNPESRD